MFFSHRISERKVWAAFVAPTCSRYSYTYKANFSLACASLGTVEFFDFPYISLAFAINGSVSNQRTPTHGTACVSVGFSQINLIFSALHCQFQRWRKPKTTPVNFCYLPLKYTVYAVSLISAELYNVCSRVLPLFGNSLRRQTVNIRKKEMRLIQCRSADF